MTRNFFILAIGFGLVGGMLLSAASAQDFSYASYDGVRTACGPDRSYNTGWNGANSDRYGSRDAYRYGSDYGSNYGSWRNNDWSYGRSVSNNNWSNDRCSRGYDSNRWTSRYDTSWNRNGYRGYDNSGYGNSGYDRLSLRRGYDRW